MMPYDDRTRAGLPPDGAPRPDLVTHGGLTARLPMRFEPKERLDAAGRPTVSLGLGGDPAEGSRLPSRGPHYPDGIELVPSRDYQGEYRLDLNDKGNGSLKVNLSEGDLAALRAALAPVAPAAWVIGYLNAVAAVLAGSGGLTKTESLAFMCIAEVLGRDRA